MSIDLRNVGFASPQWNPVTREYYFPLGNVVRAGAGPSVAVDAATKAAFFESLKAQTGGLTLGGPAAGGTLNRPAVQPGQTVVSGQDLPGPADEDNPAAPMNGQPATPNSNPQTAPQSVSMADIVGQALGSFGSTQSTANTEASEATGTTGGLLLAIASLGIFIL